MKKLFGCILSLVVAVMLVFTPAEHVYAQRLGLSVSSSSIAVGKTVKVTVSMPSGYFGYYCSDYYCHLHYLQMPPACLY
jgi:clumping factor A